MNPSTFYPLALDLPSADERSLLALHIHQNTMQQLNHADAVPIALEARLPTWRNIEPRVRCWVVWDAELTSIIANVWTERTSAGEQAPVVNFNILVQPTYRRRGIGRNLLTAVAEYAQAESSTTLITQTSRHRPEGAIWMQRIGAVPSLESRSSRLALAEVDPALVATWLRRAAERADGYTLEFWQGAYPDHELDTLADLHSLHDNVSPLTTVSTEVVLHAEDMQHMQEDLFRRGRTRLSVVVREPATQRLVGITEVTWNAKQPEIVEQGITIVLPTHRERGLGRWLKAAMVAKLQRELPDAQFVHTGNAANNTAMLELNHDLGFIPLSEDTWWEMRLAQVWFYLAHAHDSTELEAL